MRYGSNDLLCSKSDIQTVIQKAHPSIEGERATVRPGEEGEGDEYSKRRIARPRFEQLTAYSDIVERSKCFTSQS